MDQRTYQIRKDIQQWCREDIPNHIADAPARNERIKRKAMDKYGLSADEAEYHFQHNKDFD